jgi:uncharacterized protein (DUF2147 family)
MRTLLRTALLGLCMNVSVLFAAASGDEILGTWVTDSGESKVEIVKNGQIYAGKIVSLREPERDGKPVHDANNKNAALRERPLLGLEILSGFKHTSNGLWTGGTAYSPRKGESYPAELSVTKDNQLDVKVKDGIITKHVFWTR